ncbi:MAG: BlaI/MecI/CopY family transcriptional regulator [Lachnospiraceae bacterium]
MTEYRLGEIEMRFADIIWEHEPIASGELVKLAEKELTWNRSTTYTILRRLSERGLFKNENGQVCSCVTKEEFVGAKSEQFVEETFSGSLPGFLVAFAKRKKISAKELEEIQEFIEAYKEEV